MAIETALSTENAGDTGDTRELLMQLPDMGAYFYDCLASDAKNIFASTSPTPSASGIVLVGIVAVAMLLLGQTLIFWVALGLTAAQIAWLVSARGRGGDAAVEATIAKIKRGELPPEAYDYAIRRLRWWDYLVIPTDWSANSRIFDIKKKIELRLSEIDTEAMHWATPVGKKEIEEILRRAKEAEMRKEEQKRKLRSLASRGAQGIDMPLDDGEDSIVLRDDPQTLTGMVTNVNQCDDELKRITKIKNPEVRLQQEKILHQAMLIKINVIGDMLDKIAALRLPIENIGKRNLTDAVAECLKIIVNRRRIIVELNRINYNNVTRLLFYNISFSRPLVEAERSKNES
ncbi:hypothetical protein AGMMS49959_14670 [Planctomycetales bacterium]|nr:hypothetical protein AGMMS49959_14670 [Planctomycetales bacterium]